MVKKAKIMFVTYGGGHVTVVLPLARELIRRGHDVAILPLTVAEPVLSKSMLPYKTIGNYIELLYTDEEQKAIRRIGDALAKQYHNPDAGIRRESTANYYGISMYCLEKEVGVAAAQVMFARDGRRVFSPVDFMRRVLQYENADITLNTCFVRMEKATICAAKQLEIPSIIVQDTVNTPIPVDCAFSYMTTLNEAERDRYLAGGCSRNKLRVTGQPAFDALMETDVDIGQTLQERGLDPTKKTVLWLADGCPWVQLAFLEVKKAAHDLPQYNFVIKLHPASNVTTDFPIDCPNVLVEKDTDVNTLIHLSDLCIGQISTTILQSMILGKKILRLTMRNEYASDVWNRYANYYPDEVSKMLDTTGGLVSEIKKSLESDDSELPYTEARKKLIPIRNGTQKTSDFVEEILSR